LQAASAKPAKTKGASDFIGYGCERGIRKILLNVAKAKAESSGWPEQKEAGPPVRRKRSARRLTGAVIAGSDFRDRSEREDNPKHNADPKRNMDRCKFQ
jgi:hypothetical protein